MSDYMTQRVANPPKPVALVDVLIPAVVCPLAVICFATVEPHTAHWFVMPVLVCGILTGPDAIRWVRGAIDLFDVRGLIGMLAFNSFFVTPLLFIAGRGDVEYAPGPIDWRPWVGAMAVINLVGLAVYLFLSRLPSGWHTHVRPKVRVLVPSRVIVILPAFLGLSVLALAYYILARGGLTSLFEKGTYDVRYVATGFLGMISTIGKATPMLAAMLLVFLRVAVLGSRRANILTVGLLFLVFAPLPVLTGGASGSRATVLYTGLWIAGLVHFFWRKLNRKWALIGMLLAGCFVFGWKIFKRARMEGEGVKAVSQLARGQNIAELAASKEVGLAPILIGDLSRVDIQALLLYRLNGIAPTYTYRHGLTYVTGPLSYIPRIVWPSKPEVTEKIVAGTEAQMGSGHRAYKPHGERGSASARVYGLAGEALLNFNFYGVPVIYALWGWAVRRCRRSLYTTVEGDAWLAVVPFLVIVCVMLLHMDSDNIVRHVVTRAMFPLAAWWLVTTKVRVGQLAESVPAQSGGRAVAASYQPATG